MQPTKLRINNKISRIFIRDTTHLKQVAQQGDGGDYKHNFRPVNDSYHTQNPGQG